MKCPICSTENPPEASNCSQCGFSLGLSQSSWPDSPEIAAPPPAEIEMEPLPVEPVSAPEEAPGAEVEEGTSVELAAETGDAAATAGRPARPGRKARPPKRGWVAPQKREKPVAQGLNLLAVLGAAVGLVVGISWWQGAGEPKDSLTALVLCVAALYFVVKYLYELIWVRSASNVFRRSSETATGKVVRKRIEERKDSYGHKHYKYFLTFRFDTGSRHMVLEAKVAKRIYDSFNTGSKVKVRYATADPAVALLEGE
jgi:hypothetical protein